MKLNIKLIFLFVILLIGFSFRVVGLSERPKGLTWDEAALGYNAYSLIKSGKDEWGQISPVVFKSFGDYKPGLYIYFAVPFVQIFGLEEESVRLPSAIMGTLSIIVIYCLVQKLVKKETKYINVGLVVSLLLAINPWSIHFSRGAWESNVWVFFTLLSITLYIYGRNILSALFAGFTLWTYQGAKLLTPILIVGSQLNNIKKVLDKKNLLPLIIIMIFSTPILLGLSTQSGRLKVFSLFNYTRRDDTVQAILKADQENNPNVKYYLFHTEKLNQLRGLTQRYLNHFSPRFLFIEGDWTNLRQSTPYHGNFYIFEFFSISIGIVSIVKYRNKTSWSLLVVLLIFAPLGAALSRDIISGVRSLPLVIPVTIISGIGLYELLRRKYLFPFVICAVLLSVTYFADLYFIHAPYYSGSYWMSGIKDVMEIVKSEKDKYSKIVFSNKIGQPYIYTLFYTKYDPKFYQNNNTSVENKYGDVGEVTKYGKYEFRPIFWPADRGNSNTLYISDQFELPVSDIEQTVNAVTIADIHHPNGALFLKIVGLK